ncbi:MAG: 6,7-dimethyl-8-ribityllumazine synthase [Phycisphaeraceae bacterium]|nr:6,7-dimethyl-8-ribityllumazine synthase [Phycisphaeraceae bacterium]
MRRNEPPTRGRAALNPPPRVAVVVSRYNESVTDALLEGAAEAYADRCGDGSSVFFVPAPGAFEITVIAAELAACGRYDAIVALGCIIKGETTHDQHLAAAVTHALTTISAVNRTPVGLGVLTVNNAKQARERAGGKFGNKGSEAMHAALDTLAVLRAIRKGAGAAANRVGTTRRAAKGAR